MKRSSVMRAAALGVAGSLALACAPSEDELAPPAGSREILRAPIQAAPGLEVILSDVVIPPDATVPAHTHPGEELVYVVSGSAVHVEAGKPDRLLKAGDSVTIAPGAIHAPRGGPEGARAITLRIHAEGTPERIPAQGDRP